MSSMDASIMLDESQLEMKLEMDRGPPKPKPESEAAVSVIVGKSPTKTAPHCAMLDSSDEQLDLDAMDLEDILPDADVVNISNEELDALQLDNYKANTEHIENLYSLMVALQNEPAPTTQSEPAFATPFLSSSEPMPVTPEISLRSPLGKTRKLLRVVLVGIAILARWQSFLWLIQSWQKVKFGGSTMI
ncbi:hypothetical protein B0J14DRAFT_676128 [Halenospora varia]|nr:hypothetical protein B0J14DRAFT_676128 [Halenospora varia]